MEYEGKLYGRVGDFYIPLEMTTHDVEALQDRITELEEEIERRTIAEELIPVCEVHGCDMEQDSMSHEYYCYQCEYGK